MTYERRKEIFSKEYLSIQDIMELLDVSYGNAADIIRQIRRKTDRLNVQGKVHVQDYIDYFDLDIARFVFGQMHISKSNPKLPKEQAEREIPTEPKKESVPLLRSSKYLSY